MIFRSTALVALISVGLSGCETSSAMLGASQQGVGALSCNELYNTFQAYDRDQQSVDAAKNLAAALGIPYTGGGAGSYYNTARTAANVALLAQGCQPL